MKLIAILSLLFFIYALYISVKELIALIKHDGALTDDHASAHVSILILYMVTYISFIVWVYNLASWEIFINYYLVKQSGWFIISLIAWNIITTTRHFKKEREGKDFILRIKSQKNEKSHIKAPMGR